MRLNRRTYPSARRPGRIGVAHLGPGAFHRAHQAVYTEDAMAATGDDRWGISGVAQRSAAAVDLLGPQDGLYSVLAGDRLRVIGALREVLPPGVGRLADPGVRVATLTVTEKGYRRDPVTGGLRMADPEVAADLAGRPPRTVVGRLVRGLADRAAADAGPITIVSCDNLPGNGRTLARLVTEYCRDDRLLGWIAGNVRFPCTVVDRIVPATTQEDLDVVARRLGVTDLCAVVTEPFRQWVIEDDFAGARPAWEKAGALLVPDVTPHERLKLRLLNGAHSALAYRGLLNGRSYVADAIADAGVAELVDGLMAELTPTISGLGDFDLDAYRASLLERFANRDLRHRTAQIAADGSQKLPQRLLDPARELLAGGAEPRWIAAAVAAWMRYVTTADTVDDPLADRLRCTGGAPRTVGHLLAIEEIFGTDLPGNALFRGLLVTALDKLLKET